MKNIKLVYGVGINDADYKVQHKVEVTQVNGKRKQKVLWTCPFYSVWKGILERCYSKRKQSLHPTYIGCSVYEDWLRFSSFREWMIKQEWEGKHIDKDILYLGNKIYSPATCVMVEPLTNRFILDRTSLRGAYPIGVSLNKNNNKFIAQCNDPFKKDRGYLGTFCTVEEAHQAWRLKKFELAQKIASLQTDSRVANALIERYKID